MTLTSGQIEAAINAVLTGNQEYTIGDRKYKRADLEALRLLHKEAKAAESAGQHTMLQRVRFGKVGL